jgi:hypothetical protein
LFKPLSSHAPALSSTPSSYTSQYHPHYPPGHYPTSSSVSISTNPSSCHNIPRRQVFLPKTLASYPGSIGVSAFFASHCQLSTQVCPSWLLLSLCPTPCGRPLTTSCCLNRNSQRSPKMSDLVSSATGPLMSRLPGAFYYDISFDHTAFLVLGRCDDTNSFTVTKQQQPCRRFPLRHRRHPCPFAPVHSHGLHRHDWPAPPSPASFYSVS